MIYGSVENTSPYDFNRKNYNSQWRTTLPIILKSEIDQSENLCDGSHEALRNDVHLSLHTVRAFKRLHFLHVYKHFAVDFKRNCSFYTYVCLSPITMFTVRLKFYTAICNSFTYLVYFSQIHLRVDMFGSPTPSWRIFWYSYKEILMRKNTSTTKATKKVCVLCCALLLSTEI